jgi:hypothetical protein
MYEGPKAQKACAAYSAGKEGRMQGNKCLDRHEFWEDKAKENENRCYTCGMKGKQRDSHLAKFCNRPGGGAEFEDIEQRVNSWISPELPKRPNGEYPRNVQPRRDQRKNKRSKSRSRDEPRRQEVYPEGFDPWQHGEEVETRRRHALSMLFAARNLQTLEESQKNSKEDYNSYKKRMKIQMQLDKSKIS